jgi:hypothetical protein
MSMLSDQMNVPDLINQTWSLFQQTQDPATKARLAGQLQDLTQKLGSLTDKVPDQTKQEYKDAVAAVQTGTQTVKQAQADEAKVAAAIAQIAQVIAALAKVAATAAAA